MQAFIPVPPEDVNIADRFFLPKIETVCSSTIGACLAKCAETGRVANFAKAAGLAEGGFEGIFYNDSDVYKVLEGVAYALAHAPDAELEARADGIIGLIAAAQEPDGYIQTYFTLSEPDAKWTDMSKHECYCAGHLIEAGLAYKKATGKSELLDVGRRAADHMADRFGPGKKHWVTGHEEAELALFKLYERTGDRKYADLALFLLEERGRGFGRGSEWNAPELGPVHVQDHERVTDMRAAAGHAVRETYLFCAVADAARLTGGGWRQRDGEPEPPAGQKDGENPRDSAERFLRAAERVWDNVVSRKMYVTGGIGSSHKNEGFTADYDLPNKEAYCETCAAIGMVFWSHRMNMLTGEARYADIVEKELYNGALAGLSLSGDRFFYVNPLESDGTHHRSEWFGTACCPPQLARFIPAIGGYICASGPDGAVINQYIGCDAKVRVPGGEAVLSVRGGYPFGGRVTVTVESDESRRFAVRLRKPGWCGSLRVLVNGEPAVCAVDNGYLVIEREWGTRGEIELNFDMPAAAVKAHPLVAADAGKAALQKGPVVYCFEEADNPDYDAVALSDKSVFMSEYRDDLPGGADMITVAEGGREFRAVPYFAWDNRAPGRMKVWVREAG
ncbi:MAG: glycoside hydrolase family 127 protein [Firmicutes bacterium]|nr:glycoside hydrolase family 127 protein [Bacillota bacterium]